MQSIIVSLNLFLFGKKMYSEIVGTVLSSLGGATIIVGAFAHFLGKVWTARIAKSTSAKFDSDLEILKSRNTLALEEFRTAASLVLKEKESFAGISKEFYQDFFKKRVETYLKLLDIKNQYITDMEEEFTTEIHEDWGQSYHSTYKALRKLMIEQQLYISNELEKLFSDFRSSASKYIKEVDMAEAFSINEDCPPWENDKIIAIYNKFANETHEKMYAVMNQISNDVSLLRSRIEIDKT